MIIIKNKAVSTPIYVPKHYATTSSLTFTLVSALMNKEFTYSVQDQSGLTDYFLFDIDTSDLVDGEYKYLVKDGDKKTSSGLLRIGQYKPNNQEYNYTQEYYQYEYEQ